MQGLDSLLHPGDADTDLGTAAAPKVHGYTE